MRMMKLAGCLVLAGLVAPPPAVAQDSQVTLPSVNLKVSGGNRTQNLFRYVYGPFFTEELPERSGGAITTTFGSIEELGIQGPEILRLLSLGIFDISEGTISYMAGEDPHFDGLDLPGLTLEIDTQREAVEAYKPILAGIMLEKFNTQLLSMSPVALQVFYCRGEITGMDSLRGKQIRVFNRAMADLVEAVGASTVNLPFAEVIPAMQRGVADCAVTGTSAGNTARWWEVTDHIYPLPMGWSMTFFAANKDSWERFDPAVQTFLLDEFAGLEDRMWAQAKADVEDGMNCNTGLGECKEGIPAEPPMTLVELSADDREKAQAILRDHVVRAWAERCGGDCAQAWNETVGAVVGVEAPVN